MGGDLILGVVAAVLIVGAVASVPLIRARMELGRLRDRYDLTDEESEAYVREFPEICHAVESSLGPGTPTREVKRIASESAISAILRQRARRTVEPHVEVAVEAKPGDPADPTAPIDPAARPAPGGREPSLRPHAAAVKIEDLRESSNGSRPAK